MRTRSIEQPGLRVVSHRARGFTLVEGLVAGMILAMFASVIVVGANRALQAMSISRDQQQAAMLLDELLTKVDVFGPDRLLREGPRTGQYDPPFERFTWDIDVEMLITSDLYEVTARVTWEVKGRSRTATAHTRLYDPVGSRTAGIDWEAL